MIFTDEMRAFEELTRQMPSHKKRRSARVNEVVKDVKKRWRKHV